MTTDKREGPASADVRKDELSRDADRVSKTVGGDLKAAADELSKDAESAAQAVQDEAKSARRQAEGMANEQKDALAGHLDGIAGAIRHAADDLENENSPGAQATREAADRVGQLSRALKDNSLGELAGLAEDFGRRQPVAFLGASALAGFAASRFLVASRHRARPSASAGRPQSAGRPTPTTERHAAGAFDEPASQQQGGPS